MSGFGRLFAIGGAEDPDENRMTILPEFVARCGGTAARIVVCGAASNDPDDKERTYGRLFRRIGVAEVTPANVKERHDGERGELLEATRRATGIFFTGGDQLRLTALIAGTQFGDIVQQHLRNERLCVGGTSAGAAAMSSTMIIGGSDDGSVRRGDVDVAPGLSLLANAIIDTHFAQRGRASRLFAVLAENPQILAIGIDEDTAIDIEDGRMFRVLGHGAVFVFDGRVTHSNAAETRDDEVLAVTDSWVHVLPAGYCFDIERKRPLKPDGSVIEKRA